MLQTSAAQHLFVPGQPAHAPFGTTGASRAASLRGGAVRVVVAQLFTRTDVSLRKQCELGYDALGPDRHNGQVGLTRVIQESANTTNTAGVHHECHHAVLTQHHDIVWLTRVPLRHPLACHLEADDFARVRADEAPARDGLQGAHGETFLPRLAHPQPVTQPVLDVADRAGGAARAQRRALDGGQGGGTAAAHHAGALRTASYLAAAAGEHFTKCLLIRSRARHICGGVLQRGTKGASQNVNSTRAKDKVQSNVCGRAYVDYS